MKILCITMCNLCGVLTYLENQRDFYTGSTVDLRRSKTINLL